MWIEKDVPREAMLRDIMEFLGLASLVSFTSVIISISILSQGALIYYYEPNKIIWITEVLLGICGVLVGIERLKDCLPSYRSNSGLMRQDAGALDRLEG
ncbi:MAG: hypothetical protein EFT35_10025 [Methanophagales archaeon ANME-1-THS]|nr:MAG: hypothetical protein EFT35_10025 [Methanophagales archaeon ANME-1-THS]